MDRQVETAINRWTRNYCKITSSMIAVTKEYLINTNKSVQVLVNVCIDLSPCGKYVT